MRFLFAVGVFVLIVSVGVALNFGAWGIIPAIFVASSFLTFSPHDRTRSRARSRYFGSFSSTAGRFGTHRESGSVSITETGFKTFFQLAGHISKADGRVSKLEIRQANNFMDRLSLSSEQRRVAIDGFNDGKSPSFDLKRCLEKLRASSGMGSLARELLFEAMVNLAAIDGVSSTKQSLLLAYADALGINLQTAQNYISRHHQSYWQQYSSYESHREHFRQRRQYSGSDSYERTSRSYDRTSSNRQTSTQNGELKAAYETLGVSSNDSDKVVKRAYQRKIAETHPDKFEGRDLPAFLIEAATAKASELNEAWDLVKKSRRMS
ncbi:MAG: co-chaperone DjlA [Gammaproteobacteria bacterium]|nr:co-chaperone DjlA [Gammaproteobacteria bacterium]MYC25176.1 co-chaperone DjlA [Gammaproteobacteria bacterium]